jgi:hypothetical protein
MNEENKEIKHLLDVLVKRDKERPASEILRDMQEAKHTCACGKQVKLIDLQPVYTGVVGGVSDMCKNCTNAQMKAKDRETTRVFCYGCKKVVARIPAHTDAGGFEFKPGAYVHTENCPECATGLSQSTLVEKEIHNRKKRK